MPVELVSTTAKVNDVEKTWQVLSRYDYEGVTWLLRDEGTLKFVTGREPADESRQDWPHALTWDQVPNREDFSDEDSYYDAMYETFCERGDEGFLAALVELAPYLEAPLVILGAMDGGARAWLVLPGATKVETLDC